MFVEGREPEGEAQTFTIPYNSNDWIWPRTAYVRFIKS